MNTAPEPIDLTTKPATPEQKKDTDNKKSATTQDHKQTKSSSSLLVLILFLIAIIGITIPLYLTKLSNAKVEKKSEDSKLSIETQNQEIKDALMREFVYAATGPRSYYSPTLDVSFELDPDILLVSEGGSSIGISPRSTTDTYGDLALMDEDPLVYYKKVYAIYDQLVFTDPVTKDGYQEATATYQKHNILNKDEKIPTTTTFLYKKDAAKNKYIVLRITVTSPAKLTEALSAQYATLIKSTILAPTNVAPSITASISDVNLNVSFDKKLWSVMSQSTNFLSLSYVTPNYTDPIIFVRINAVPIFSGEKNTAYLEKLLADELAAAKKYNQDVTIISDNLQKRLAGQDMIGTEYSYKQSTQTMYVTKYFGFAPNHNASVDVSITKGIEHTSTAPKTFADSDIAKLLESGLEFTQTVSQAPIRNVLGENAFTIDKPALIGKLGTVHIANTLCTELEINDPAVLPAYIGKKMPFCYSSTGSGFFVSSNGTIITNAHVAANNPFSGAEYIFVNNEGPVFRALYSSLYAPYLLATGKVTFTEADAEDYASYVRYYILKLIGEKKLTLANTTYQNYLETSKPFSFDSSTGKLKNPADYAKLTVVKANTLTSKLEHIGKLIVENKKYEDNPYALSIPDLAVLKIDDAAASYPTLALASTSKLLEGTGLLTIGFPGLADNRELFSDTSSMSAIIAKGTLSAIKPTQGNLFNLIQTDATINHGNSGGPMVNNEAEVIGVSTYLLSDEGGSYGTGISVEEVSKLLQSTSITPDRGAVTTKLLSALDNLQKEYYQWAVRDLDAVLAEYPLSQSVVKPLRALAQEKIDGGLDNTPLYVLGTLYIHKGDLPYILGGLGVALLGLILGLTVLLRKKKTPANTTPQQPTQPPVQPLSPLPTLANDNVASAIPTAQEPPATVEHAMEQAMAQVVSQTPVTPQADPVAAYAPPDISQPEVSTAPPPPPTFATQGAAPATSLPIINELPDSATATPSSELPIQSPQYEQQEQLAPTGESLSADVLPPLPSQSPPLEATEAIPTTTVPTTETPGTPTFTAPNPTQLTPPQA